MATALICHININSLKHRLTELVLHLEEHKPHIVTINETKLNQNTNINIPNYHILRQDRNSHGGGVAILIKENIQFNTIDISQFNQEALMITFKHRGKEIALATIYNKPLKHMDTDLIHYIQTTYPSNIIIGDFNARHAFFGDTGNTNAAGDHLFNITETYDLHVANNTQPTHTAGGILDLALLSTSMLSHVYDCDVVGDIGSDHYPLHVRLVTAELLKTTQQSRLNMGKTDWNKFRKIVTKSLPPPQINNTQDINTACNALENTLTAALKQACPTTKQNYNFPRYISEKTRTLIKTKRKVRRLAQKTQLTVYKQLYHQLAHRVKESIQHDKREQWQQATEKLNEATDGSQFWQTFNRLTGKYTNKNTHQPIRKEDGTMTKNNKEKADAFAKHLENTHNTHQGDNLDADFKKRS